MLLCIVLISTVLYTVSGIEIDRHTVPCGAQQKVCECRLDADECEFTLVIEKLYTFTSYEVEIDETDGDYFAEGGTPYYFNASGNLRPSLNGETPCFTERENFGDISCTVPQTVDGNTYRPFIGVNGLIPGPTLIVNEGQNVIVNVKSLLLAEVTSIHWHGIHMRNTPWMDGALLISQCPINPDETFSYYFTANPTGSFWYHSHRVTQRADGLYGALIVKESPERIQRLEETLGTAIIDDPGKYTINVQEWTRMPTLNAFNTVQAGLPFFLEKPIGEIPLPPEEQVMMGVSNPYTAWDASLTRGPDGLETGDLPFWSGLINGKGRHESVPYNKTRLEIFTVEEGSSYRFRLIGVQGLYSFKFSIDEHNLTVLSTDGSLIEPISTQFIILHTGERYDFILTANRPRSDVNDYWIRAETLEVDLDSPGPPYPSRGHVAEAILHYGASVPKPRSTAYQSIKENSIPFDTARCSAVGGCIAVNCPFRNYHESYNIHCINPQEFRMLEEIPYSERVDANPDPECSDCEQFFNVGSNDDSINGRNMKIPTSPLQTQKESIPPSDFCDVDNPCPGGEACSCVHVRQVTSYNETIRFILSSVGNEVNAGGGFTHPIHLHGHYFQIVTIGYGTYDQSNGFLLSRNEDIDCGDAICSSPGWRGGQQPTFTTNDKAVFKDTVIVPAGGYVVVQFRSDNPGFWFMHCHIVPDLIEGMAVVINEVEKFQNPPPEGLSTCGDFNISQSVFYEKIAFDPLTRNLAVKMVANVGIVVINLLFLLFEL